MEQAGTARVPGGRELRLTRRGRFVLLVLLVVLLCGAFGAGRVSTQAAVRPARLHTAVVRPGETLWSFAVRIAPAADPRVTVAELERLNHLSGPQLAAGQTLLVP